MIRKNSKQILGVIMIVVGVLFLLANFNMPVIKWSLLWPVFLLLLGGFLLRMVASRKNAEALFGGLLSSFLGFFFLLFTTGILEWSRMSSLWPVFPLMGGISLLAVSGIKKEATGEVVVGTAAIVFSVLSFLYAAGLKESSVVKTFVRFWPLVLVAAGAVVFLKARREGAHRETTPSDDKASGPPDPTS